jgi:hypothetical protein
MKKNCSSKIKQLVAIVDYLQSTTAGKETCNPNVCKVSIAATLHIKHIEAMNLINDSVLKSSKG